MKFINFNEGYGIYCSKACELYDTITIDDEYVRNYLIGRGL
nr:MAG TPA: 30S ribosomal protein S2 [Bacteriophage sp.]